MTVSLSTSELTPLEHDLLARYHARYAGIGFPSPGDISIASRKSSTAGRYVYLSHPGHIERTDGQLGLGTYSQVNLTSLEAGASFHVWIENGKVVSLDIHVNGSFPWDGSEGGLQVCDPDTGAFTN